MNAENNSNSTAKRNKTLVALNHYVNKAGNHTQTFFNYSGGIASSRIQLKPALIAAKRLGINTEIWSMHATQPEDLYSVQHADLCVIGKLTADSDEKMHNLVAANLAAVSHLKRIGASVILLYSDNHLDGLTHTRELYKDLIFLADAIVCPSQSLKKTIDIHTQSSKRSYVIEDPWSLKKCSYQREERPFLKLGWFGSGLNIPYLAREIPEILKKLDLEIPVKISVLSSKAGLSRLYDYIKTLKLDKNRFQFELTSWSHTKQPEQLENFLQDIDIALIPSDPNDPKKKGVSHNRLVDASRRGCVVIASPMESYKELSKISILGNNFPKMIKLAFNDINRLRLKYETIRDSELERFSPQKNEQKWATLMNNFISF